MKEEEGLTVLNFEYAVLLDARLVSLFRLHQGKWQFEGTAYRWNGITKVTLEQSLGYGELYVFPFGYLPDQIWAMLHRLEMKETQQLRFQIDVSSRWSDGRNM